MKKYGRIFTLVLLLVTFSLNAFSQVWAEITHFDDAGMEGLGSALAIDGNIAIVGASRYNSFQGCAYVMEYNENDTTWQKVARLTASDGNTDDRFGFSVDISGNYIVIGSPSDDEDGYHSGSAYVFTKPAGGWTDMTETAKIMPFDGDTMNNFGKSIAIHGETVLVGAPGGNQSENYPGYAYYFNKPTTGWEDTVGGSKLSAPDGASDDYFGTSVVITDDAVVISAPFNEQKGAAYVYTKSLDEWTYSSKLSPSHNQTLPALYFGFDVRMEGDVVVVGAPGAGLFRGRVYVYEKPAGGWSDMTQTAVLSASDKTDNDSFGTSLDIYNDTLLVGSDRNDAEKAVYLFKKPATGWENSTEMKKITAPDDSDNFGYQVGIHGNNLIIGDEVHFFKFLTFNPVHVTTHPGDTTRACLNTQVNLSITASNARGYQWQVSNDNGETYTDVTNDTIYSSATTSTLGINVYPELEHHVYRCIASNPQYADTSTTAILLLDEEAPTIITQPTDQLLYAGSGCQAALPGYHDEVDATDNCAVDTIIQTPPAGTLVDGDINPITLSVRDERGNETTVDFNVSVVDTTRPDLQPNDVNLNVYANDDCVGILPDYGSIIQATDNCDDTLDVAQSPETGSGITDSARVNLTFTDDAGNSIDTSFWVHVEDTLSPVIVSEHDDVILPGGDECSATLPDYTGDVMVRENCSASVGVVQSPAPGTLISGAFNVITLAVSDESGNTAEITFEASVEDTLVPSITCAGDTTIDLEEGESVYIVPGTQLDPRGVEDNCGFTMVSNDFQTGLTLEDAEIPGGTHDITWTVMDGAGNKATCTTSVTVNVQGNGTGIPFNNGKVSIYPNPTKGSVTCYLIDRSRKTIAIHDITGKVVYETVTYHVEKNIDISGFHSGIYLLKIQNKNETIVRRIIKE